MTKSSGLRLGAVQRLGDAAIDLHRGWWRRRPRRRRRGRGAGSISIGSVAIRSVYLVALDPDVERAVGAELAALERHRRAGVGEPDAAGIDQLGRR